MVKKKKVCLWNFCFYTNWCWNRTVCRWWRWSLICFRDLTLILFCTLPHPLVSSLSDHVCCFSSRGVVLCMLPLWTSLSVSSDCVSSLLNICWLDICKNNKVTKHELLNLQLLFTLIIFLAWGGRYILQEVGVLLASFMRFCFKFIPGML